MKWLTLLAKILDSRDFRNWHFLTRHADFNEGGPTSLWRVMVSFRLRQFPVKPPMQQVTDWLEKLGMSEYAQLFADNSIDDVSILRDLTDQDLKEVGVPLGHRRKILRAIAELDRPEATAAPPAAARAPLSGPAPRSPSPTPVTAPPQSTPQPQEAAGERRYLTVMFCDLVNSTGIAAKLDAEEWRDLVNA